MKIGIYSNTIRIRKKYIFMEMNPFAWRASHVYSNMGWRACNLIESFFLRTTQCICHLCCAYNCRRICMEYNINAKTGRSRSLSLSISLCVRKAVAKITFFHNVIDASCIHIVSIVYMCYNASGIILRSQCVWHYTSGENENKWGYVHVFAAMVMFDATDAVYANYALQ